MNLSTFQQLTIAVVMSGIAYAAILGLQARLQRKKAQQSQNNGQ